MTSPRKVAPFFSLAILAGVIAAVRRRWADATTWGRIGFAASIGGAIGLLVALVMRALK